MPHIRFNWVDVLFVILLFRIAYVGLKNGILSELFRVLGLLSAFLLSFNTYTLVGKFLSNNTKWTGSGILIVSFLLIFLSVLLIFKILALVVALFSGANNGNISVTNRLTGLLLSIGRGFLLISLIYVLVINIPFEYVSKSAKDRSFSAQYISNIAPNVYKICMSFYPWAKVDTPLVKLLDT